MAAEAKKGLKGSIDDVIGDLLGDDMALPEMPVKLASRARDTPGRPQVLPSRARTKTLLEADFLSTMAGLAEADGEVSDISEADPQALLQAMKDMDDMDADLLGLKKSKPASSKTAAKSSEKEEPTSIPRPVGKSTGNEKGDAAPIKKSPPSPGTYVEDPLTGLLSDDEEGIAKQPPMTESKMTPDKSPSTMRDQGPSVPLTPGDTPIRKKGKLLFDDGDDIMATLGFGDSPEAKRRQMGDQEGPRPARSKLDELLGRGTAAKLLVRPGTGEHRDIQPDRTHQRLQDKEDIWDTEEFTFGAYQPSVCSSEGRQSRRQSARFLAESSTDPKGDLASRQSAAASSSPVHPRKGGADWLGLKDDDFDFLLPSPTKEAQRGGSALCSPSVPPPDNQLTVPSQHLAPTGLPISGAKPPAEGIGLPSKASQASKLGAPKDTEAEDWLSHALSRKKSHGLTREEQAGAFKSLNTAGTAGHPAPSSQPTGTHAAPGGTLGTTKQEMPPARPGEPGPPVTRKEATTAPAAGNPKRGAASGELSITEPVLCLPSPQEPPGFSVPVQSLLLESVSRLPGTEYQKQLLAAQAQLQGGTAKLQAELLQCQTRMAELEAQVRKLELERNQHTLLLESLQQQHQADLELIESAHRSRVKVLETSYQQREERLRVENEELAARYLSHCREAEQARAELAAQHQRHLAAAVQEKDQEVERLRELQRASILEMRKDHEEQLQRLKLLKDQEIDAVTSATSQTRSLRGIIEQMEKFSSNLNELSSRVEASHLSTSQEWELGVRQHDEQLRVMQERLGRQQRDMEDERGRLQEVIVKMEARLSEQSRLLEQERWRVSAEQSKAESAQRSLEEQRRVMVQQTAIEREELERAKSALLEEQKSVMHKCGEERRRLAAEWAEFFAQQKLSKEQAERQAERALQADTQREGTLISLAKEKAELKIRASELRAKEDQLVADQEALEREQQELRLEKERVSAAALRLRLRAEEVEGMSKVASEKYEAGEQALREARQVQSEHQARLQQVQWQQEQLRQQEQQMHQEHVSLAQQRQQLDRIHQDLPFGFMGLLSRLQGPAAPSLNTAGTLATTSPSCHQPPASLGPSHLSAKLVLLKHTAEQDRDFLENEQFFLETLKKAPYNKTSHSAWEAP